MNTSNIRHSLTIVSLVVALSACASTAPAPTLTQGESIAIRPPVIKRIDSTVDSKTKRAGRGAAFGVVGAAGGAALGSSMGGLFGMACGPAAIICVPIGIFAGGGIGAVGGGIAGAGYGGSGGIAGSKAARFNEIATREMDEATLATQLHDRFSASARPYWNLRDDSTNTVVLEVTSLKFEQIGGERLQLVAKAEMHVQLDGRSETVTVERNSASHHIDYWLAGDGDNLRSEIDSAMQKLAQAMVGRIVEPHRIARR